MLKYKVYTYDVWGSLKDGFEINNVYVALIGKNIFHAHEIILSFKNENSITVKNIVKKLRNVEWFKKGIHSKRFSMEYTENAIYIEQKKDCYPVCELRLIDNE